MNGRLGLAWIVFFPFLAGILIYGAEKAGKAGKPEGTRAAKGRNLRDFLAIGLMVPEFAGMVVLTLGMLPGRGGVFSLELPLVCGQGLSFALDGFRAVYGCVAAFLWMMVTVFSREYFACEEKCGRFYLFLLWTLGAVQGVFLSADLYTTFLFFEIMSFTSYVWVVQEETPGAMRAADTYLAVAVLGGLVLLMGLFLLGHLLGTLEIGRLSGAAAACGDKKMLYAAGGCMLFGFGAKAGAFPLHIWLPKAHPAAPAPGSALLSGVLTKTGVYGILILSYTLFFRDRAWGNFLLLTGMITMLGGAVLALFSVDLKRTLACSSMSQIGFILAGIGTFSERGTLLHMVNHSLIKLILFLAAGVVYKNTHSLDLNRVRGFGRKKPLLMGVFLTGAFALGGIPFFGGYISKTLLHEGILEWGGSGITWAAEAVFLLSGGFTVAYMTKLFLAVFVEKNEDGQLQEAYDEKKRYWNPGTAFVLAVSALLLLLWGAFPHGIMEKTAAVMQDFPGMTGEGHPAAYFSPESIKGALISGCTGIAVYLLFVRTCLMRKKEDGSREYADRWPEWLDLEELLCRPILLKILPAVLGVLCRILDSAVDLTVVALRKTLYRDSRLPHERPEGNVFTETLGRLMNAVQELGNHTWRKGAPRHRDYVHLAAIKNEEIRETNHIIRRSLSFGLLLVCIGLTLTLFYIIWW